MRLAAAGALRSWRALFEVRRPEIVPRVSCGDADHEGEGGYLARSRAEFETLWKQVHGRISGVPELPRVDFAKEDLVLIHGSVSSGGYTVRPPRLFPEGDVLAIDHEIVYPDSRHAQTMRVERYRYVYAVPRGPWKRVELRTRYEGRHGMLTELAWLVRDSLLLLLRGG